MKVVKTLLTLVLVVGVLGGAAYGAGHLVAHRHSDTVASSTDLPGAPDASQPTEPTSTPTSSPTTVPTHRPRDTVVLKPGAKGPKVRELQQRLFQIAWLPETTTGVYDATTVAAVKGFQAKHGLPRTGVLDPRTWKRIKAMTSSERDSIM